MARRAFEFLSGVLHRQPRAQAQSVLQSHEKENPNEIKREAVRAQNQVRLLNVLEETLGFRKLPDRVYGFTLAPHSVDWPVLREPRPELFEVHKTSGGALVVLGYVSSETARAMGTARGPLELRLFSAPREGDRVLVSIPMARAMRYRQGLRAGVSFLEMEVDLVDRMPAGRADSAGVADVPLEGRITAA